MSAEQQNSGGYGPPGILRRISAVVGRIQSSAHTKKDLINLRRRRWTALKKRLTDRKLKQDEIQTEEPAEPEREEP